jgi:hypothetical protein
VARGPSLLTRLQGFCQQYRQDLLVRQVATADEIAACWPGGADNNDKSTWGWVRCYGSLRVMVARLSPAERAAAEAQRKQQVLDALSDTPETVELSGGVTRTVYAKSDVALGMIDGLNRKLAAIVDDASVLRLVDTAEAIDLCIRAHSEQSFLQRVMAWIITTPGPGLPFPENAIEVELPDEYASLTPIDYYILAEAFQRVNILRLAMLSDSRTPGKRPDWPVYWASVSGDTGIPVPRLRRDQSLASLLATNAERARAHREAMAERDLAKLPQTGGLRAATARSA